MSRFEQAIAKLKPENRTHFLEQFEGYSPAIKQLARQFPPETTVEWKGHTFWVMGYTEVMSGDHNELMLSPFDPREDLKLAGHFMKGVCVICGEIVKPGEN